MRTSCNVKTVSSGLYKPRLEILLRPYLSATLMLRIGSEVRDDQALEIAGAGAVIAIGHGPIDGGAGRIRVAQQGVQRRKHKRRFRIADGRTGTVAVAGDELHDP